MRSTPRTIAVVGPDGCGKTTQATLLVERLQRAGYDARYVHALYYLSDAVPGAERLRRRFGPRRTRTQGRHWYRPLSLARRVLFALVGLPFALCTLVIVSMRFRDRHQVVVFDRYYHQFCYDVYGPFGVHLARLLPQPTRTIYLETDLPTIESRMDPTDRAVEAAYYASVIDLYDDCSSDDWLSIRGDRSIEAIHERIVEAGHFDGDASPVFQECAEHTDSAIRTTR